MIHVTNNGKAGRITAVMNYEESAAIAFALGDYAVLHADGRLAELSNAFRNPVPIRSRPVDATELASLEMDIAHMRQKGEVTGGATVIEKLERVITELHERSR
ncbi:hypothetical protein [Salibacterium halotolerans]|uniref:Uncharacterized protein n=1 Tax=Salibacterium halotolerans TaxID=1884432 RepID=A0A1I5UXT4_9BACI|nr:hypothetical protein [Salibacterium halotolerans]SFP99516.1 hypothetical protein SAMN05518683_11480 [Salibacterium halotolerans]